MAEILLVNPRKRKTARRKKPMARKNLTPGFKGTLASFKWIENDKLMFIATVNAHREMWTAETSGELEKEDAYEISFYGVSFDKDNN